MAEDYAQMEYDSIMLSNLPKLENGQALIKKVKEELDKGRDLLETQPQINNENIKEDFRFKLGRIDGLKWMLALPEEALKILTMLEEKGGI